MSCAGYAIINIQLMKVNEKKIKFCLFFKNAFWQPKERGGYRVGGVEGDLSWGEDSGD